MQCIWMFGFLDLQSTFFMLYRANCWECRILWIDKWFSHRRHALFHDGKIRRRVAFARNVRKYFRHSMKCVNLWNSLALSFFLSLSLTLARYAWSVHDVTVADATTHMVKSIHFPFIHLNCIALNKHACRFFVPFSVVGIFGFRASLTLSHSMNWFPCNSMIHWIVGLLSATLHCAPLLWMLKRGDNSTQ